MLEQVQIADIIDAQCVDFMAIGGKLPRETLSGMPIVNSFAAIITGVGRCHFEYIRLVLFETSDFVRLHAEII